MKEFLKRYFEPQFIRFVLVAMLNTAFGLLINYVFLFIFEQLFKLNHAYVVSNFFATIVSILFNFKTYGILVFKNKDNKLLLRFLAVTTFTYLVNIGGIALLEHIGSHNNYLNLTIMAVPVGLLNYVLNSVFVYKKKARFLNINRKQKTNDLEKENLENK
ncbi:MAG: GtrA family protein [Bacteroidales bacterium]|jgi:putative flippase GtrA|nr:GtrA family protein [Bacteroidales bacterium]